MKKENTVTKEKNKQATEMKVLVPNQVQPKTLLNSEEENAKIDQYVLKQRPANTLYSTKTAINCFRKYCKNVNETREPENIPANELDTFLAKFVTEVRRKDGKEFEPDTLSAYICGGYNVT